MRIIIYEGTGETLVYRGEFEGSNLKYNEDLTKLSTSSVNIPNSDVPIKELDLFYTDYKGLELCGRITKIERYTNYSTLTLAIGHDAFNFDVNMPTNKVENPNMTNNYMTALYSTVNATGTVTTSDRDLTLDTFLRQLMRQENRFRQMTLNDNEDKLLINIQDTPDTLYHLDLSDNNLSDVYYMFATDSYNYMRLKKDGKYIDYYYTIDGRVTTDVSEAQLPLIQSVQKIEEGDTELTDTDYVLSKFKSQEYNHVVEFNYDMTKGNLEALRFDETILGRKLMVYIQEYDIEFKSMISAVSIENNIMSIKLGISRIRYSEQKQSDL